MNLSDPAFQLVIFSLATWLLAISYFLGYNANKLNNLKAAHEKTEAHMEAIVGKIFDRLDALASAVPHHCRQIENLAGLQTALGVLTQRTTELENWRHAKTDN